MKQTLIVGCVSLAIFSSFAACGNPSILPDGGSAICSADYLDKAAQACADRGGLGFAREFGSGTLIGTRPQDTLSIKNGGLEDLTISSANLTGDPAFTVTTEPEMLPAVIKGNKYFFMRVVFTPTEARLYTATLTVQSNGGVSPSLQFELTGCGIPADGGTSPCYRDGGRP